MKQPYKPNPNVLLTEKCNRSCAYCFARDTMKKAQKKEMSLISFKQVINFLEKNKQEEIRLMGGEPTLHSQFREILDLALSHNLKIKLFTNGLFSFELANWMAKKKYSITYTLNLTAIVSEIKSEIEIIEKNVEILKKSSRIHGSITIDDADFKHDHLIEFIIKHQIQSIRIGIANNMVTNSNCSIKDAYKDIILNVIELARELKKIGTQRISLSCGFTPCMFKKNQLDELKNLDVEIRGWGCNGKLGSFDTSTDLNIFPCFITEDLKIKDSLHFNDSISTRIFFENSIKYLIQKSSLSATKNCKKCHYFKLSECSGPCLGYILNNENEKKIIDKTKNGISFKATRWLLYRSRNWIS